MSNELTQEKLKIKVHFDPNSGIFTKPKKIDKYGRISGGFNIGSINKVGNGIGKKYQKISVDGKAYLGHRLAWLYIYGNWPKNQIDHIDGNSLNNSINNLRDVSRIENSQNIRSPSSNNKTGYLGVFLHKQTGKYRTRIMVNKKIVELGLFKNPEDAHAAYINAKRELHSSCTI